MKAISINAWKIENNDGETLVFMTPEEFDFIQKYKENADKEIERLNNIIEEAREYTSKTQMPEGYKKMILDILDKGE